MRIHSISTLAALLPTLALAQYGTTQTIVGNGSTVMPNGKYEISSEGIRANFIPYGASISNLFIMDVHGIERDIVLGFDNASYYSVDTLHPHLGGVPGSSLEKPCCQEQHSNRQTGRYANRIKNSSFTIDGETYHVSANENHGLDTLHGGADGWYGLTDIAYRTHSDLVSGTGAIGPLWLIPRIRSPFPFSTQTVWKVSLEMLSRMSHTP